MNESDNKYLIFRADNKKFAMSFADVLVIVPAVKASKIPDFPDYAEGNIVNDGKMVTVLNLRKRFGYTPKDFSERDCIIICDGRKSIGLLCDSIDGFCELNEGDIQPAPDINEQVNARFMIGEFLHEGQPCYIIKPELVIREDHDELFKKQKSE